MKQNKAFTMIELSIVVLIIGVLVAATLKVRTMIDRANYTVAKRLTENSPVTSTPNLEMWFETTSPNSFEYDETYEGSAISIWNDIKPQSQGAALNATQSEQAEKPIYTKNAFGSGIPGLKFDGDYSNLDMNSISEIENSDYTVFIIDQVASKFTSAGGHGHVLISGTGGTTSGDTSDVITFGYLSNEGLYQSHYGNGPYPYSNVSIGKTNINTFQFEITGTRGDMTYYFNGGDSSDRFSTNQYIPINVPNPAIGGTSTSHRYHGYIGEIIIFSRKLTNSERKDIEEYLSEKYNVPIE